MNIILTGATSFLGRAVTENLTAEGHEVYAVIRPLSAHAVSLSARKNFHRVECDIGCSERLTEKNLPPMDACVHLAWDGEGQKGRMDSDIQEQNVKNTLKMMQIAHELSCRKFLFAGSQAEYGVTEERVKQGILPEGPVSETGKCRPVSEYGKAKYRVLMDGSTLAELLGINYFHMRIFSVYGPGDHGTALIPSCVRAAKENTVLQAGLCTQMWNYLYVSDCAGAVSLLLKDTSGPDENTGAPEDHVVNVGSETTLPLKKYMEQIFDTAHSCGLGGSFELTKRPEGPEGTPWLFPDITRLKRLTGFQEEIPFRQGIEKCFGMAGGKK